MSPFMQRGLIVVREWSSEKHADRRQKNSANCILYLSIYTSISISSLSLHSWNRHWIDGVNFSLIQIQLASADNVWYLACNEPRRIHCAVRTMSNTRIYNLWPMLISKCIMLHIVLVRRYTRVQIHANVSCVNYIANFPTRWRWGVKCRWDRDDCQVSPSELKNNTSKVSKVLSTRPPASTILCNCWRNIM